MVHLSFTFTAAYFLIRVDEFRLSTGTCDWAEEWRWHVAQTSFPFQVRKYLLLWKGNEINIQGWHRSWRSHLLKYLFFPLLPLLSRSSTTPSRNFTTSPKLSSNSTASISSTVTNGDSSCSPGYTLNNSTSSGNRWVVLRFIACHWLLCTQSAVLHTDRLI